MNSSQATARLAVDRKRSSTISRCRVCEGSDLAAILDLGAQPPANSLRRDESEALPIFPLIICRCGSCGTIQLTETVDPELLFEHYVWVTGTSRVARDYSRSFCERLRSRGTPGTWFVVEVASNDGTFLRPFVERGDRVLGVDPAKNIAAVAQASGVPTVAEFFGLESARRIVSKHGEAEAVFARNVIPHVANASDVVAGMAHCLKATGVGAIEFHRADVILQELHYDSIYHEHLFYHSLDSLTRLLERFALFPFDVAESPISGGSLVVYFSKTPRPATHELNAAIERENSLGIGQQEPWLEFARRCHRHRQLLRTLVEEKRREGKRIVGYGASARSSTLLNYCAIDHRHIDVIADRAELKHDHYTPGTNILIVPPETAFARKPDVVLLLAWNFREEILEQIRREQQWHGEVIVPLPGDPAIVESQ